MELYFSEDEMIEFLEGKGYTVEYVKAWVQYSSTHGTDKNYPRIAQIAYSGLVGFRDRPTDLIEKGNWNSLMISPYSLEKVFQKELQKALLQL